MLTITPWNLACFCTPFIGAYIPSFSQKAKWARPGFEPGTSRTLSENHTPRPTSQLFSLLRHSLCIREITPRDVLFSQRFMSRLAPWLSWLKRLSSKQEIPSSNLGGASLFFPSFPIAPHWHHLDISCSYCPLLPCQPG